MRLCKDCKHVRKDAFGHFVWCGKYEYRETSPVDGSVFIKGHIECQDERAPGLLFRNRPIFRCGPQGEFWEQRLG